jgi:Tol biopolymer transport system component
MFDLEIRRGMIRWAPDNESVLLSAIDGHGRDGIYRIDLSSGELSLVRRFAENETDRSFGLSPDGRSLYFARIRTVDGELVQGQADIVEYDLETGRERAIQPVRERGSVVPSPDGAWLAFVEARAPDRYSTIQLIPAEGGRPRILHRGEPAERYRPLGWTPDGRWLLFYTGPPGSPYEVWRVSRAGGDAERVAELPATDAAAVVLHPDGRTIAYLAGQRRGEIWALEVSPESAETDDYPPEGGTP